MRKLATAAITFSVAVFASHYLVPPDYYLLFAAVCGSLSLTAVYLKGDLRSRILLISFAAVVGFSVSYYSYLYKTVPARDISGTELKVTARVTDYPNEYENYSSVSIHLTGDNVPNLNGLLYSFDTELPTLSPGDIVSANVRLKTADERYGEAFSGNISDDVYLLCYINGELEVIGKSPLKFLYFPKTIAKRVNEGAVRVFSENTAPFMTALLTGETKLMYSDTSFYANMAEAGILHIVAVSGMNVAFLVGFIQLAVRRKRLASLIGIPMVCLFVPFAGATPSVIRAAFMQIMILIAPILRRENDSFTSLSTVLAVMLLINPKSCASIGLQLSFAATLGIILVAPKIYKSLVNTIRGSRQKSKSKRCVLNRAADGLLNGICATFASTIGALLFSTPVAILYFGYVSIIGILVNILVFWTVSVCFIIGYIACFLGMIWLPMGTVLGFLTSLLVRYIIAVSKLAASVPYAAIYTQGNIFGYWIVLLYFVFILCSVFRRKEGFRPVIPICLAISSLCCVILVTEFAKYHTGSFIAANVGQGQSLIMTMGNATAVIDCGGKGQNSNAGETVGGILLGGGRRTVDVLALTHFDDDHVNGVIRLMSRVNVRRLVIPEGSSENTNMKEILSMAEDCKTEVYIIRNDTVISVGDLKIFAYSTISQKQQSLLFLGCIGDFEAFVSGDADEAVEQRFVAAHTLPDTELYVAGHHGSKYSSSEELLKALNAEYAVVSSGYNNYGHPTQEALERLENAGMKIFRTDRLGNIRIKISG